MRSNHTRRGHCLLLPASQTHQLRPTYTQAAKGPSSPGRPGALPPAVHTPLPARTPPAPRGTRSDTEIIEHLSRNSNAKVRVG
jgi:hypothetical protein